MLENCQRWDLSKSKFNCQTFVRYGQFKLDAPMTDEMGEIEVNLGYNRKGVNGFSQEAGERIF
jgi:hypothetical protein